MAHATIDLALEYVQLAMQLLRNQPWSGRICYLTQDPRSSTKVELLITDCFFTVCGGAQHTRVPRW